MGGWRWREELSADACQVRMNVCSDVKGLLWDICLQTLGRDMVLDSRLDRGVADVRLFVLIVGSLEPLGSGQQGQGFSYMARGETMKGGEEC